MTNMWQKRCSNIGKTTLRKKNVEPAPHRILSVLPLAIPFASLANEGRFVSLEFTFELRDKDRIATLTMKRNGLSLLFCENVRCADDFWINASLAVPFLCLSIQRHVRRWMCGITPETLPILVWPPHGHFISW